MPMTKQPEGVRRVARVAGEKPPQSYNLYLGRGPEAAYLGWSERLDHGKWQAHPAVEDGTEIPPFRNHTALVEFLLSAHRGLEVHPGTQDVSSAEETAAILPGPQTMAAIAEGEAAIADESVPMTPLEEWEQELLSRSASSAFKDAARLDPAVLRSDVPFQPPVPEEGAAPEAVEADADVPLPPWEYPQPDPQLPVAGEDGEDMS